MNDSRKYYPKLRRWVNNVSDSDSSDELVSTEKNHKKAKKSVKTKYPTGFFDNELVPESLDIVDMPDTVSYTIGSMLDLTGLEIDVAYSNGDEEDITDDCDFTPVDGEPLTTAGMITVNCVFIKNGVTLNTSFNVTVAEATSS
jgi:hypothetical protein